MPNLSHFRSPLAASATTRIVAAILLCALLWLTIGWALEWGVPA
jgi:hypothetical protein